MSDNPVHSSQTSWHLGTWWVQVHLGTFAPMPMSFSMQPILNSTVILPNHISISVHFSSDVKLIIRDVLYVPQFECNLLFASALSTVP